MLSVIPLSFAVSLVAAQSLLTPIDFTNTLEAYYYFRSGSAGIAIDSEGITVTGASSTEELCEVLDGAQIVYSADGGEDTLIASNCYNVYNLVTADQTALTWTSCIEFPFDDSVCGSDASAAASGSLTATASLPETTVSNDETLVLTTVTSYSQNVVTEYTTYCPITEIEAAASIAGSASFDEPESYFATATIVEVISTLDNGEVTTLTDLIPLTEEYTGPATTVITVTSCSNNACSQVAVTTGVTVVTKFEGTVVTSYTTYCPLSTEAGASPSSAAPSSTIGAQGTVVTSASPAVSGSPSTKAVEKTVVTSAVTSVEGESTVVSTITETKTKASASASASSVEEQSEVPTTPSSSSIAAVSTFEGSAAKLSTMSLGLAIAFIGFFF